MAAPSLDIDDADWTGTQGASHAYSVRLVIGWQSMSRELQTSRIREIGKALTAAGYRHIDSQAEVLGLSRSTAWTILQGNHKHTGLTASVVHQMLESEKLPASVRSKIIEYVAEKLLGHHGHSEKQILYFSRRLSML